MRLAPPALPIDDRDGFNGTDIFGYEAFGTNLAALIESLEGPCVIALDGDWGSGKTVFAKQWAGLLRNRGTAVIYFDAFAADSGDDPLFDIASQLFAAGPEGEARAEFAKGAVALAKELIPLVAGAGLSAVSGGLLGPEAVKRVISGLTEAREAEEDAGEEVSMAFRRRLEGSNDRAAALTSFRESLIALAAEMRTRALEETGGTSENGRARPVVVIIDELDRCKPSYALHLLENLKHVFGVESICFVLVTNLHQLAQVVSSQYGVTDAHVYLEKFVHATFILPEKQRYARNREYIRHLFQDVMGFEGNSYLREPIELAVSHTETSLRGIERVIPNVAWCLTSGVFTESDGGGTGLTQDYEEILVPVVVCAIRALNPEMYAKLRIHRMSCDDVVDLLRVRQWEVSSRARKEQIPDILARAFPPRTAVEGDGDAMREWRSGSLRSLVDQVCQLLDVLGDPMARRSN